MTLGNTIAKYRKQLDITQDALARQLEVSNQAVSKWESDQCCPDILLLPKLADIFGISLDALFGRSWEDPAPVQNNTLPWEDDGNLRAVVYVGRTLVGGHPAAATIQFQYEGPALNVYSDFSVTCDDVAGDVHAAGSVTCDDVSGNVSAGGNVTCDTIDGNARAGGNLTCDEIMGDAHAGGNLYCDHIGE